MEESAIYLISVASAVAGALSLFLIIGGATVRRRQREMSSYETFIRRTYIDEDKSVPVLVLRHYGVYVDRYNSARRMVPFRYFTNHVHTDDFQERFAVSRADAPVDTTKQYIVKHKKHNKR